MSARGKLGETPVASLMDDPALIHDWAGSSGFSGLIPDGIAGEVIFDRPVDG